MNPLPFGFGTTPERSFFVVTVTASDSALTHCDPFQ